jgi:hypothetical protein
MEMQALKMDGRMLDLHALIIERVRRLPSRHNG